MKKILYIDPISSIGHKTFNEILIKDILETGCSIDLVSEENYFDFVSKKNENVNQVLSIENSFFKKLNNNPILNRWILYKILYQIKKKVDFASYDYVIFSSYDEVSLYFANIKSPKYLVNHNNLSGIDNCAKRFFLKSLSRKNKLIVLHNNFRKKLLNCGINSLYVPHGLPNKFNVSTKTRDYLINSSMVLYSPSSMSSDELFYKKLIADKTFLQYIEDNNIILILKGKYASTSPSIIVLDKYIREEDYKTIFTISDVILINYNENFKNRVSGVFYEAISNDKTIMTSKYFYDELSIDEEEVFNFYNTITFIDSLDAIFKKRNDSGKINRNKQKYQPNIIKRIENES